MSAPDPAELIRRLVDNFGDDVEAVQLGVVDGRTPEAARQVLATALTYVVNPFDLAPDHLEGLGLIDDAAILRLAAWNAVSCGADQPKLVKLAGEAADLAIIFGDLMGPLQDYLNDLHRSDASGLTPTEILDNPERRMQLWHQVAKRRDSFRAQAIAAAAVNATDLIKTLQVLVRGRLKKAGTIS